LDIFGFELSDAEAQVLDNYTPKYALAEDRGGTASGGQHAAAQRGVQADALVEHAVAARSDDAVHASIVAAQYGRSTPQQKKLRDAPVLVGSTASTVAAPSATPPCDISVTGHPSARAELMGAYALQPGNATGGRPAYLDASNGEWLYHTSDRGGAWCISPDLGGGSYYLFVIDQAQTPDAIVATWYGADSGTPAPSVKASCAPRQLYKCVSNKCTPASTGLPQTTCEAGCGPALE
jgi:hypothetical protein